MDNARSDESVRANLTRRRALRLALAAAGALPALALAACGAGGPAYTRGPEAADAVVEMTSGLTFEPRTVTVRPGQVVEWRNTSLVAHTVTFDPAKAADAANAKLPQGAEAFDSGEVPPGEVFRRRFFAAGTYRYTCIPHEGLGMQATIVVERPQ